jgi:hypothetical protein
MNINGTEFYPSTPIEVASTLERLRQTQIRCRFYWGDQVTGLDWGDTHDVVGRVGRSTGEQKVPLLIHNARSMGGGAILTHCIVKITEARGGRVVYQHPNYHKQEAT